MFALKSGPNPHPTQKGLKELGPDQSAGVTGSGKL